MTPILTLWPSASTAALARQTEANVDGSVPATAGIYESCLLYTSPSPRD